jgi:hypothetical protein
MVDADWGQTPRRFPARAQWRFALSIEASVNQPPSRALRALNGRRLELSQHLCKTNDEIARKHGNVELRLLRKIYGPGFAPGFPDNTLVSEALDRLDWYSISRLHHHHTETTLEGPIHNAGS